MMFKNRLKPITALAFTALTIASLSAGCSAVKDAQNGLCCTKFVAGADMTGVDFGLKGDIKGQFAAFAEAGSDLSAVASASLTDVAVACESIARDVGASDADITTVDTMTGSPSAKTKAWCDLATATIKANFSAKGTFGATASIQFDPPRCTASVSAQANCEASCTVSGMCTADAMVSCEGGKLPTVECTGSCDVSAEAPSVSCTGTCSGKCSGSCSAEANVAVDCSGKCDGDCTVDGKAGSASGIQADGSCKGKCSGTCTASGSAAASCSGTCSGTCDAKCTAKPGGVKFDCNGKCSATAGTPPRCEGSAKLDCDVKGDCEANCQASVSAKAECTPPRVAVVVAANADVKVQAKLDVAVASLETNLPQLLVVLEARGKAFTAGISASVTAGANLTTNVGSLNGEAVFCLPPIVAAIGSAADNFKAAFDGALSVTGSVGVPAPTT